MTQTKKDIIDVLELYRGLTFKLENFGMFWLQFPERKVIVFIFLLNSLQFCTVFNDGNNKELLNINGTIPVVYKSK